MLRSPGNGALLALLTWMLPPLTAEVLHYTLAPDPSARLALTVEKTGLLRGKKHLFVFDKYEGRLDFDAVNPTASAVQLTIDSRSIVCQDDWVSAKDLKSVMKVTLEDMLDVARSPTMTFTSNRLRAAGDDAFDVDGTLTLRGRAQPALVKVRIAGGRGQAAMKLDGTAVIRLTSYGLKPPSALLGAIGTRDDMTLAFSLTAARR